MCACACVCRATQYGESEKCIRLFSPRVDRELCSTQATISSCFCEPERVKTWPRVNNYVLIELTPWRWFLLEKFLTHGFYIYFIWAVTYSLSRYARFDMLRQMHACLLLLDVNFSRELTSMLISASIPPILREQKCLISQIVRASETFHIISLHLPTIYLLISRYLRQCHKPRIFQFNILFGLQTYFHEYAFRFLWY